MKYPLCLNLSALILLSIPSALLAQEEYEYHPAISDNFYASIGAMKSSNSFKMRADPLIDSFDYVENEIDFGDSLGVSDSSTLLNAQLRWKFGKKRKWGLAAQYFSNNATGSSTLKEDVDWEGIIFREGTFAEAGVKMAVARLFVGRSLYKTAQSDFGLGIGIHNLDLSVFIKGELKVEDETTGVQRVDESASQILLNLDRWGKNDL